MYVITHTQSHTYIKYTYTHAQILHPHMAKGSLVERTERKKNRQKYTLTQTHTHTHVLHFLSRRCSRMQQRRWGKRGGWVVLIKYYQEENFYINVLNIHKGNIFISYQTWIILSHIKSRPKY
jgi:hypothetical protein